MIGHPGSLASMRSHRLVALALALAVALLAAACGGSAAVSIDDVPPLPTVDTTEMNRLLAASQEPVVLNAWASWCIPCRSEAPLLATAAADFDGQVRFVGLNIQDTQQGARTFIAEFYAGAPIRHFADPDGRIPADLGAGPGIPITFFYAPGGELRKIHIGVIDERTLALQIDELVKGA